MKAAAQLRMLARMRTPILAESSVAAESAAVRPKVLRRPAQFMPAVALHSRTTNEAPPAITPPTRHAAGGLSPTWRFGLAMLLFCITINLAILIWLRTLESRPAAEAPAAIERLAGVENLSPRSGEIHLYRDPTTRQSQDQDLTP